MSTTNVAEAENTPQQRHKKKLLEQEQALRKAKAVHNKVVDEWYELVKIRDSKKGGKVRHYKKMADFEYTDPTTGEKLYKHGNTHSIYIGREADCKEILAKAKKEGKLRI